MLQRYGYRPFPVYIEQKELDALVGVCEQNDKDLLLKWFDLDTNKVRSHDPCMEHTRSFQAFCFSSAYCVFACLFRRLHACSCCLYCEVTAHCVTSSGMAD